MDKGLSRTTLVESADISTWVSETDLSGSDDEALQAMNELDLQEQKRGINLVSLVVPLDPPTEKHSSKHKKHSSSSSGSSKKSSKRSPRSSSSSSKSEDTKKSDSKSKPSKLNPSSLSPPSSSSSPTTASSPVAVSSSSRSRKKDEPAAAPPRKTSETSKAPEPQSQPQHQFSRGTLPSEPHSQAHMVSHPPHRDPSVAPLPQTHAHTNGAGAAHQKLHSASVIDSSSSFRSMMGNGMAVVPISNKDLPILSASKAMIQTINKSGDAANKGNGLRSAGSNGTLASPPEELEPEKPPMIFVNPPKGSLVCPIHNDIMIDPVIAPNCGHSFCRSCILNLDQSAATAVASAGSLPNSNGASSSSSSSSNVAPAAHSNAITSSVALVSKSSTSVSIQRHSTIEPSGTRYPSFGSTNSGSGQIAPNSTRICPFDGQLIGDNFVPNRALAAHIDEQLVYCRYGLKKKNGRWVLDREGCPDQVPLGQIAEHEAECGYGTVHCPFCSDRMRRKFLDDHVENCDRQVCPNAGFGCTFVGQREIISKHLQECIFEKLKGFIISNHQQVLSLQQALTQEQEENQALREKVDEMSVRLDQLLSTLDSKFGHIEASLQLAMRNPVALSLPASNNIPARSIAQGVGKLSTLRVLKGHNGPVWALAVAGDILVSGSSDSTVKVWNIGSESTSHGPTFVAEGIIHAVGINFRLGRRHILSGSSEKFIKVWDIDTGKCVKTLTHHENTVCSIVVGAGYVFTGSFGEIKVWNPETYEEVKTLRGHNHWVRAIAIHDRTLYGGSYGCIKTWDLNTFECTGTIQVEFGSIYSIAVAGKRLLVGTFENLIYVVDFESKENYCLHGHQGAVYSLCVCGDRFFSSSYDTTIRMWNLATLRCIETIGKHNSSVEALVQSGEYLFSGSTDGTIKLWGYS